MSNLKVRNTERCITLLREFIEATPSITGEKEYAVLALNQLQAVFAGGENTENTLLDTAPACMGRPIMNFS